jgi:hypothetical protein
LVETLVSIAGPRTAVANAARRRRPTVRILVLGDGVIGSIYAGEAVTDGTPSGPARPRGRLADLRGQGLVLQDAESGDRTLLPVRCVGEVGTGERFDPVLVRAEQLPSTLPLLIATNDDADVLFFGNPADHRAAILATLGKQVLFGLPAAGGIHDGPVGRYVLIGRQQTMLGEPDGTVTGPAPAWRAQQRGVPHHDQRRHRRLGAGERRVGRAYRVRPLPGRCGRDQARRRPRRNAADGARHPETFTALRQAGRQHRMSPPTY